MGIIGAIGSALIGASSARSAAKSQEAAANRDLEFQRETRDLTRADLAPFRDYGGNALAAYGFEMGLGPRPVIGGRTMEVEEVPGQAPAGWSAYREPDSEGRYHLNLGGPPLGPTTFRVGDRTFGSREEAHAYANANSSGGTPFAGFTATPGYQFRVDEAMAGLQGTAAARGSLLSGRAAAPPTA